MPRETDFIIVLEAGYSHIRVRFVTDGMDVTSFLVQLEVFQMDEWRPVQRVDDYHGRPHRDSLDWWGREFNKEWLDADRNTALTMAIQDFKANWERYVTDFLKRGGR